MAGFGSSSSGDQSTLSTQPWGRQQPYLVDAYSQGKQLYQQGGIPAYPGQTYASFNPVQSQYMSGILGDQHSYYQGDPNQPPQARGAYSGADMERGLGHQLVNAVNQYRGRDAWGRVNPYGTLSSVGKGELQATAAGARFGQNPWLDSMFDRGAGGISRQFANVTIPQSNSMFSRAGRSGSGIAGLRNQENFNSYLRSLGDYATQFYGGAYQTERQNQLDAARFGSDQGFREYQLGLGSVPGYVDLLNQRTDRLGGVGQQIYGQSQRMIDDEYARWQHMQMQPWENLGRYSGLILGQPFTQTDSQSYGLSSSANVNFGNLLGAYN